MHSYEVDVLTYSPSVPEGLAALWKAEVARRFPGALMLLAHGGEIDGEWVHEYHDPTDSGLGVRNWVKTIRDVQAKYPGRFIVLISCNPSHLRLPPSVTGVAYALQSVWVEPDNQLTEDRSAAPPELVGNIFEFVVQ